MLYGPFNSLLLYLFPPTEGYQISPQYNLIPGAIDFSVVYLVIEREFPIFFIEIKTPSTLYRDSARETADNQMRERFQDILNTFGPIPLPAATRAHWYKRHGYSLRRVQVYDRPSGNLSAP